MSGQIVGCSPFCPQCVLVFCLFLFVRQQWDRKRQRDIYPLVHFPSAPNSQDWATPKPGARSSVFLVNGGDPSTWAICCLPGCTPVWDAGIPSNSHLPPTPEWGWKWSLLVKTGKQFTWGNRYFMGRNTYCSLLGQGSVADNSFSSRQLKPEEFYFRAFLWLRKPEKGWGKRLWSEMATPAAEGISRTHPFCWDQDPRTTPPLLQSGDCWGQKAAFAASSRPRPHLLGGLRKWMPLPTLELRYWILDPWSDCSKSSTWLLLHLLLLSPLEILVEHPKPKNLKFKMLCNLKLFKCHIGTQKASNLGAFSFWILVIRLAQPVKLCKYSKLKKKKKSKPFLVPSISDKEYTTCIRFMS